MINRVVIENVRFNIERFDLLDPCRNVGQNHTRDSTPSRIRFLATIALNNAHQQKYRGGQVKQNCCKEISVPGEHVGDIDNGSNHCGEEKFLAILLCGA